MFFAETKVFKKKVSNLPSNDSRKKKILFALYLNLFYKFEILNFFIKIVKTNKPKITKTAGLKSEGGQEIKKKS